MHGKRILVIDDDPSVRGLIRTILASAGAEVRTASNGQEGLCQLYAYRPDLILLNVVMPGMYGWTLCPVLRRLSDTPIIFVTGFCTEQDAVRGLSLGAVDFITKPFRPQALLARAQAALRQAERPRLAAGQPSRTLAT
jgi:DNA-binding response OmpR family regulator